MEEGGSAQGAHPRNGVSRQSWRGSQWDITRGGSQRSVCFIFPEAKCTRLGLRDRTPECQIWRSFGKPLGVWRRLGICLFLPARLVAGSCSVPPAGRAVCQPCLHALTLQPQGAPGKFLPMTSASELEQFPRNQPHPACSSQGPDGRLTLSLPPLGCLSGASPLPPGAAQCLNPRELGPSRVTSTHTARRGGGLGTTFE